MSEFTEEYWVEMPGFPNYVMSNYGNARLVKSPYSAVYSVNTRPTNLKIFTENGRHYWKLLSPNGIKDVDIERKVLEVFNQEDVQFDYSKDTTDIKKDTEKSYEETEEPITIKDPEDDNNSSSSKALDFVTNKDLDLVDSNSAPVTEAEPTIKLADNLKKGIWRVSDGKRYSSITKLSTEEKIPYQELKQALRSDGKFEHNGEIYRKA